MQAMHKATEEEAQATVGAYSTAPSETGFWIADRCEGIAERETRAHTPRRQPSLARTVVRARTRTAAQVLRRDRPTRSHARPPPAAQARPTKERGAADASPVPPTHPPPTPLRSRPSFPARPVPAALCLWWSAALLHDCPREYVRRVLLSQVLLVRTSKPSRAHMPHMSVRAAAQGPAGPPTVMPISSSPAAATSTAMAPGSTGEAIEG